MTSDAIVVGGGVGGLVAARRLAREGFAVTLLERSGALGGQVARQRIGGVDLDAAAESFATRGGAVAAFLAELGLGDDIVTPNPAPAWLHRVDGSAVPLPSTGLLGIPGEPLAADVVNAIGRGAAERAARDADLPALAGTDAASLGELVRLRMGDAVVAGLVAPVVRGVHSVSPDALPVERAHPRLRAEVLAQGSLAGAVRAIRAASPAGSQVAGIRGGMFRLVDALEADCRRLGVRIEVGARVTSVEPDAVVVAGRRRAGLVLRASGSVPDVSRRVTLVTLLVDAPALDSAPRGTGVLVAADAPAVRARALTHLTGKWEWIAAALAGRHAVRLSYDGVPEDAVATAARDAGILLGHPRIEVLDATQHTWDRGAGEPPGDLPSVGETAAGTGLASVIPQAERIARELSQARGIRPVPATGERMEG
ncbi:FAD-dependent oxidoreductase [Microbacterium sp. BK668]|uniref:protoporphyrinogen/coproporphyrinogen oxidase n=1 Tax=Microbacterium sp. BK668 TaxID=2512118 RepID=UPI0010603246|nr:FAD-dependent oxidoreductase [Microbacterium sp. BK668]TDN92335.1 oxygen-dependent protoporphyrinogen oxidase [Microbacterium sp. BK668]